MVKPSITTDIYTPDRLIAGEMVIRSINKTLLSGENRARGTLLGAVTVGAATPGVAVGTGNGVAGATTLGKFAKVGNYVLTCVLAAANGGRFQVVDPDGNRLPDLLVGVAYVGNHINLTVADGAADFVVGDTITVAVAAGSGKLKMSAAAAVDGSQVPRYILAETMDASAGDKGVLVYEEGDFNSAAMTFGAGHTAASVRDTLRGVGIYLHTPVAA